MADASIIDIGGTQWNVKDKEAREKVTTLEEKTSANFNYSEEEKVIGTWIDGKPLYRLIIQGVSTNKRITINLSDRNIAEITKVNGMFNASDLYIMPLPNCLARSSAELGTIYAYAIYSLDTKNMEITFGNASYYSNVKVILQLEYTKNE